MARRSHRIVGRSRQPFHTTLLGRLLVVIASCSAPQEEPRTEGRRAQPPPPVAPPARARAFRIERASQLLEGPAAQGRLGDVRMENGRAVFVISAIGHEIGFSVGGGHPIDAAPTGGRDHFGQAFPQFGPFPNQAEYERLAIEERGASVVVRVTGRESHDPEVDVETTYELRDGSPVLQIRTTLTNRHAEAIARRPLGDAVQWVAARAFYAGTGWTAPQGRDRTFPYLTAIGTDASYAYGSKDAWVGGEHGRIWSDTVVTNDALPPGVPVTYRRFLAVVPGASTAAAAAVARAHRGEPVRGVRLTVDSDAEELLVRVEDVGANGDGSPVSFFRAHGGESVLVPLRRGRYAARVVGPDRGGDPVRFEVESGDEEETLGTTSAGAIEVTVKDGSGAGIPARLVISGVAPTPDPELGPWTLASGTANVVHTHDGRARIPAPPGRYRIRASHGPEWEIAEAEAVVAAGRPAKVDLVLRRSVDTAGYLCADMHQHVWPSLDSGTQIRDRVIGSAAEGVEIVVSSDHNWLTDFGPAIRELGLQRLVRSIVGDEVTPDTSTSPSGHFNVFPLVMDPDAPRGGAIDPRDMAPAEFIARLLADGASRAVQVNHPRSAANGFFTRAQLDRATGTGNWLWDPGFHAVEVWNGKRFRQLEESLGDLRAFWTRGIPYTATGNSDTHDLIRQEAGYPRTYLRVPTEDLEALRDEDVVEVLVRTHDAIVTNGPFVTLRVAETSIGGFASLAGGRGQAHIEVRAPGWMDVGTIELRAGDVVVFQEQVPRTEGEPVTYAKDVDLALESDAWIQAVVRTETPHPLLGDDADPIGAFTNPIWIDVDGNGRYDAP